MASRPTRRGDGSSPKVFHELGVKGRKTGAVLRDAGVRDEHGMQPLDDDMFSSPKSTQTRPAPAPAPAPARPAAPQSKKKTPSLPPPPQPQPTPTGDYGSDAMDIASSAGPGPQTVLRNRSSLVHQLPKSRSPPKTNLRSPARRNPNIHSDSPARRMTPSQEDGNAPVPRVLFSPKPQRQIASRPGLASTTRPIEYEDDDDDGGAFDGGLSIDNLVDESIDMMNTMQTDPNDAPSEPWGRPAQSTPLSAVAKGKQKAAAPSPALPSDPPVGLGVREESRTSREPSQGRTQPATSRPSTMKRPALEAVPENEVSAIRAAKKQKPVEPAPVKRGRGRPPLNPGAPKRGRGRPRKGESVAPRPDERDETYVEVQRGPPLPKSRGLVSFRHGNKQSHSRPSAFAQFAARGEPENVYDDGAFFAAREARRGSPRESRHSRTREPESEEDELEDWEQEADGQLSANVMVWNAEYELDPSVFEGELEERIAPIAVSARGLISKPYKNGGYAYAHAMREQFMSAGVVDLPPGAVKRQKPSQDMHLVFFVHYGKAMVTVNDTTFHISKGGMWFVPRQNTYSIANDSTSPCRVFFTQARELFISEDSS